MTKDLRQLNPICLLSEHGICNGVKLYGGARCECNCHIAEADMSFFEKPAKDIMMGLGYSLWSSAQSSRRAGFRSAINLTSVEKMVLSVAFRSGSFEELDPEERISFGKKLAVALIPTINRSYWSSMETEDDILPVLQGALSAE